PIGLPGDHAALHELHDDVKGFLEPVALVLGLDADLDGVVDERARAHAEHGTSAREVGAPPHAAREGEGVAAWQIQTPGAEGWGRWGVGSGAAEMNISGQGMISKPAEWCSPIQASWELSRSRWTSSAMSRSRAKRGVSPPGWYGPRKMSGF